MSSAAKLGRRSLMLAALSGVAGCSSPDPRLYVLQPVPGPTRSSRLRIVALRGVTLARYLERPQIVRSAADYRLDVEQNDWWGEPLAAMVGRVLARDLILRLPGTQTIVSGGAVTTAADATVEASVQRLDADAGGVRLQAQLSIAIGDAPPRSQSFETVAPLAGGGVADQVAASSTALGALADALAAVLSGDYSRS